MWCPRRTWCPPWLCCWEFPSRTAVWGRSSCLYSLLMSRLKVQLEVSASWRHCGSMQNRYFAQLGAVQHIVLISPHSKSFRLHIPWSVLSNCVFFILCVQFTSCDHSVSEGQSFPGDLLWHGQRHPTREPLSAQG